MFKQFQIPHPIYEGKVKRHTRFTLPQCSNRHDMIYHSNLSPGHCHDDQAADDSPGVLLGAASLHLEQRGVLVLVALAALVAGEHGLGVQTS